jgi:drug/metabolite transporter (DMT)-like permease
MAEQPRLLAFCLIVVAVCLSATGELLLKKGMSALGGIEYTLTGLVRTFTAWPILLGFGLLFVGALIWLKVLSLADLSWAYPLLALGYPLVVIGSFLFLGETVNLQRLGGAAIIVVGVFVMFHSWNR